MVRSPRLPIEETEPGSSTYVLTSNDFDLYEPQFHHCDREGGGYDWEFVAKFLLRSESRKISNAITFDSEASLFCALSDRRAALGKLASSLCHTFRSKRRLVAAIREAESLIKKAKPRRAKFDTVVVIHFNRYLYYGSEPLRKALKADLPSKHPLVYYPAGAGEETYYVRTNNADEAIYLIRPILRDQKLLNSAIIAVAPRDSSEYVIVHPRNRRKPLVPKTELPSETFPYEDCS